LRAAVFCCASLTERRAIFHSFNPSSFLHVIVGLDRGRGRQTPWQGGCAAPIATNFFRSAVCAAKNARAHDPKNLNFLKMPYILHLHYTMHVAQAQQGGKKVTLCLIIINHSPLPTDAMRTEKK
jgi:hypothetical protein